MSKDVLCLEINEALGKTALHEEQEKFLYLTLTISRMCHDDELLHLC